MGLNGRLLPFCNSMELNASPLGSTPTCSKTFAGPNSSSAMPYVNGLEMDWMVKGWSQSPASKVRPSAVTRQRPNVAGSALPSSGMYVATCPLVCGKYFSYAWSINTCNSCPRAIALLDSDIDMCGRRPVYRSSERVRDVLCESNRGACWLESPPNPDLMS